MGRRKAAHLHMVIETPAPAFEVHPYSLETLVRLTATLSRSNDESAISRKSHPAYLDIYFKKLGVRTIVVEREYVDRDYLEDFAAYYVRCFEPYERKCARLHFFKAEFDEVAFRDLLLHDAGNPKLADLHAQLHESYCGFIVIKPLPQTIFGRTCLRTYPSIPGREFPVTSAFRANLFGISLKVPHTLPFQEQDNVVAACATSALWSALQATAKVFQHALLTPIDVTRAATTYLPAESRMIPNRGGLSSAMMAEAIRAVGLEPMTLTTPENEDVTLRAALYAYLRARIPLILGVRLVNTADPAGVKLVGDHAVAVTGFMLSEELPPPITATGFRLRATRMRKIYAHDDQVGPFARMVFDPDPIDVDLGDVRGPGPVPARSLSTSWRSEDGSTGNVHAVPLILVIPLYHKIRILFDDVMQVIVDLHKFLGAAGLFAAIGVADQLEWDIHLTTVNDLKTDLHRSPQLKPDQRLTWLSRPMPRFVWRAIAAVGETRVMEVLFDATDIHTNEGVFGVVFYEETLDETLHVVSADPAIDNVAELPDGARRVLHSLRKEGDR